MSPDLLQRPVVVNVGLHAFADALEAQGATTLHVEWSPPRRLDPKLAQLLDQLG